MVANLIANGVLKGTGLVVKTVNVLTETADGTAETALKWYEKITDWFAKPEVAAIRDIVVLVGCAVAIYALLIKPFFRKMRKK